MCIDDPVNQDESTSVAAYGSSSSTSQDHDQNMDDSTSSVTAYGCSSSSRSQHQDMDDPSTTVKAYSEFMQIKRLLLLFLVTLIVLILSGIIETLLQMHQTIMFKIN